MSFTFRDATAEDLTYIKRLNYLAEVFGDESQTPGPDFVESNRFYIGAFRPGNGVVVIDDEIDNPAGGAWFLPGSEELHGTGFVEENIPEVALAVEKRYQGHGLGTKLMERVADLARKQGHPGLSLCVHEDNPGAQRLYEKLGYEAVEKHETGYLAMVLRWGS